jgi:ribonuclease R
MYQLGDVVDVRLIEAAPIAGALRFELLSSSSETAPRERRSSGPQRRPSFKAQPGRSPAKKHKPAKPKSGKPKKGKGKNKGKGGGQKGKAW